MNNTEYTEHEITAARRQARRIRSLYAHVASYIGVISLLSALNMARSFAGAGWWHGDPQANWTSVAWVAFGWGIGLAAHMLTVATSNRDDWVDNKADELLRRQHFAAEHTKLGGFR